MSRSDGKKRGKIMIAFCEKFIFVNTREIYSLRPSKCNIYIELIVFSLIGFPSFSDEIRRKFINVHFQNQIPV